METESGISISISIPVVLTTSPPSLLRAHDNDPDCPSGKSFAASYSTLAGHTRKISS